MEKAVAQIFRGWLTLSAAQQQEVVVMIQTYQRGTETSRRQLGESVSASVTKMHTGPLGDTCRCCGR